MARTDEPRAMQEAREPAFTLRDGRGLNQPARRPVTWSICNTLESTHLQRDEQC